MKKTILSIFIIISCSSFAQESFSGFRSGAYNGVHSVLSNPANIAANNRKWDANLFSVNTSIANNEAKLNFKDLKNLEDIKKFKDLGNDILENNEQISSLVNIDILGPSFMYNINEKHSISFTSRVRAIANASDIDIALFKSITESKDEIRSISFPIEIGSNKNQKIAANGWSEFGLSWAGTIYQDNSSTIKVGATLKYLRGFSNSYANIDEIRGTINEESAAIGKSYKRLYFTDARGAVSLVNSGADFDNLSGNDITKSYGNGFGADLGIVYEYRDENTYDWAGSCGYAKSYKFKLGFAILDLGSIKYTPIEDRAYSYILHINKTNPLYLDEIADAPEETLNKSIYATKEDKSGAYSVSLPSTLRLNADYHIYDYFFVAMEGQFSILENDSQNPYYTTNLTLTPRYEHCSFGAYIPIGYNKLSGLNVGSAFKLGPLFFGSGSVLTTLIGESKQLDFFFGIRFGK